MTQSLVDLRAFLDLLRKENELVEIDVPVSADLEAAEIHRRVIAAGGPALLFKNIEGSPWPCVTNLFGTARRVELAFGKRPEQLIQRIADLPHSMMPPSLSKAWQHRDVLGAVFKAGLQRKKHGPVTEVVDRSPGLGRLPLLRTWPDDGGFFVTLPLVYTEHPGGLGHNLGMYRIQRFSDDRCGLHVQIGKGGGFHLAEYERLQRPMPVNINIGGPPALILSAIAPLPENVPELLLGSLLQGQRMQMADNPLGPLPVAAKAEFTIVGEVQPGARHPEGPFGDHYGYYSLQHDYPLVQVHGLLRRREPILAATVVGKPRQEDFFLGDYLQELLTPLIGLAMPAVRSLWSYGETGYHSLAAAIVNNRYRREAMASAFRILGEGQLSLTKFLLLTDRDVDLRNFRDTLEHVLARTDLRTDLYVFGNLSMDSLDYSGPKINEGSKGVLLGLGDPIRELPASLQGSLPLGFPEAQVFCPGCLVVTGPDHTAEPDAALRLAQVESLADWPMVILCDDAERVCRSDMNFLWTTFTRFEPAADIHTRNQAVVGNHVVYTGPMVIDARFKASYPEELFADEATASKVGKRWRDYFPTDVEMGDSDQAHLD
jgi:UbiD family decarboxylase